MVKAHGISLCRIKFKCSVFFLAHIEHAVGGITGGAVYVVHQHGIILHTHHVDFLPGIGETGVTVESYCHFPLLATFGSNAHDTVGRTGTIHC